MGAKLPCDAEILDIAGVDRGERREALLAIVAPVRQPVFRFRIAMLVPSIVAMFLNGSFAAP